MRYIQFGQSDYIRKGMFSEGRDFLNKLSNLIVIKGNAINHNVPAETALKAKGLCKAQIVYIAEIAASGRELVGWLAGGK